MTPFAVNVLLCRIYFQTASKAAHHQTILKAKIMINDFESAQALPALPENIASDGRPVDEEPSTECIEKLRRKKRIPKGNKHPSIRRDWRTPILRAANDNVPLDLGRFNPAALWVPKTLPTPDNDNVMSPRFFRAVLNAWRARHPETDSKILPRANRNSAKSKLSKDQHDAFETYFGLCGSNESSQSNYESVAHVLHGKSERKFDLDTPEALVKLCKEGVEFDTIKVRVRCDGPQLSEWGYASAHAFRTYSYHDMEVPADGDNVERQPVDKERLKSILADGETANSGGGSQLLRAVEFARRLPRNKPDSIAKMRETRPDITLPEALERKREQKRSKVLAFVKDTMKLPVARVGMLLFADTEERTRNGERCGLGKLIGKVKRSKDGNIKRNKRGEIEWFELRDEFTDPKGTGAVSKTWDEEEAAKRGWMEAPNAPGIMSGVLSAANSYTFEATPQTPNNGRLVSKSDMSDADNPAYDDMHSQSGRLDDLQDSPEDLLLRRDMLTEVNARLSPQARETLDLLRGADEDAAQTLAEIGGPVTRKRHPSHRTLERNGLKAVQDAADELCQIFNEFQQLAA